MMPDLPNVGLERDIEQFIVCCIFVSLKMKFFMSFMFIGVFLSLLKEFFENPAFRADGLKIYPTLVIRGTGSLTKKIVDIYMK